LFDKMESVKGAIGDDLGEYPLLSASVNKVREISQEEDFTATESDCFQFNDPIIAVDEIEN